MISAHYKLCLPGSRHSPASASQVAGTPSRHPRPAPLASGSLVDSQPLSDIVSNIISPSENFQLLLRRLYTHSVHTLRGSNPLCIRSHISLFSLNIQNSISQVFLLPVILIVISSSPKQKFEPLSRGVYTVCDIETNIVLSPVDIRNKYNNH